MTTPSLHVLQIKLIALTICWLITLGTSFSRTVIIDLYPTPTDSTAIDPSPASDTLDCGAPYALYYQDELDLKGLTLVADSDFLYLGGGRHQQVLVVKTTRDGQIVWQHQLLPLAEGTSEVADLRVDSEGNLLGCGTTQWAGAQYGFAFKIKATDGQLLWSTTYLPSPNARFSPTDIYELSPGGHYFLLGSTDDNPLPGEGCDASLYTLDRNSGALLAPSRHYNLGACERFAASVLENGLFHATGPYTFANSGFNKVRPAITSFDLSGTPIWSRLYLVDVNQDARLSSVDIIRKTNALNILIQGDDQGTEEATHKLWLLQANLAGSATWAQQYTYPEVVIGKELIADETGFYLLAQATQQNNLYVTRTDLLGEPLWSRVLADLRLSDLSGGDEALLVGGWLHLIATRPVAPASQLALIRMDPDGALPVDCIPPQPVQVEAQELISVYDGFHQLTIYDSPTQTGSSFSADSTGISLSPQSCFSPCNNEICGNALDDDGDGLTDCQDPDLQADCCCYLPPVLELGPDASLCAGDSLLLQAPAGFTSYLWSDGTTDSTRWVRTTGLYTLSVQDRCGNTQRDSIRITAGQNIQTSQIIHICSGQTALVFGQQQGQPGTYSRTYTAANGCDSTHTIQLRVETLNLEVAVFYSCTGDQGIVAAALVDGGTQPYTYTWTARGGEDGNVDHLLPGVYGVTVTSARGCVVSTTFVVEELGANNLQTQPSTQHEASNYAVEGRPYHFPPSISPNGDGKDDFFTVFHQGAIAEVVSLQVFSRWGEQVFSAQKFQPGLKSGAWTGQLEGEPLRAGTYVFHATLRLQSGALVQEAGEVMLIR